VNTKPPQPIIPPDLREKPRSPVNSNVGRHDMLRRLATRIAIYRLCRHAKQQAARRGVHASVTWFGAYYIHPRHLAVIVRVPVDRDKAKLSSDSTFLTDLRNKLIAVNYPTEGRESVAFEVESQETVDREFNGNWYYRFK
jgi:hypothetical protein